MGKSVRAVGALLGLALAAIAGAQDIRTIRSGWSCHSRPAAPPTSSRGSSRRNSASASDSRLIVDNRPGAGSNIGTDIVAKAPKDGYTLVVGTVQHIVNRYLFVSLPYDPVKDFDRSR